MVEFHSYPDIENSYREKFIDIFSKEVDCHKFYITEKIHGANSQIAFFKEKEKWDTIKYGKRTSFIPDDGNFYNLSNVFHRLLPKFESFMNESIGKECDAVVFYGEVFGGAYPHKEIDKSSELLPHNDGTNRVVQHGVWYCPEDDWACFDIRVRINGAWKFINQNLLFSQCEKHRIPTVPLLGIVETLKDALEYPNNGESVVFKRYGLPKIENNIMEGVVIKPLEDCWLSSGERAVIKNKNDHFKEIHHHKIARVIEAGSPEAILIEQAKVYVTEQRLNNVISKHGEVNRKDIGLIIGNLGKDACDEFIKDHDGDMNLLTDEQKKQVKKVFGGEAAKLVREILVPKL